MMISYIKGCLERIGEDFIIIDNQGIGYKICVSGSTKIKCLAVEKMLKYILS